VSIKKLKNLFFSYYLLFVTLKTCGTHILNRELKFSLLFKLVVYESREKSLISNTDFSNLETFFLEDDNLEFKLEKTLGPRTSPGVGGLDDYRGWYDPVFEIKLDITVSRF